MMIVLVFDCRFSVRTYGMGRFLHHEGLSAGCFNAHHTFSNSATLAWEPDMTNSEELLLLVTNRMEK